VDTVGQVERRYEQVDEVGGDDEPGHDWRREGRPAEPTDRQADTGDGQREQAQHRGVDHRRGAAAGRSGADADRERREERHHGDRGVHAEPLRIAHRARESGLASTISSRPEVSSVAQPETKPTAANPRR